MGNDDRSGKKLGFLDSLRQKIVDDILSVSQKHAGKDGTGDADGLKQEQLSVLEKYEGNTETMRETFSSLSTNMAATQAFAQKGARRLNDLLVGTDPTPFDDLSQLDERFGPLSKGMSYRYLAPQSGCVTAKHANFANNVIRIPTAFGFVLDEDFERPGDELPARSLADWQGGIPAALSRLWTLRLLVLNGLLRRDELPSYQPDAEEAQTVHTPFARHHFEGQPGEVRMDPSLAVLLDRFRDLAIYQYDSEVEENASEALSGVMDKSGVFQALWLIGANGLCALRNLLDDPDIGVRVSAATYLLKVEPEFALPLLQEIAATWPADELGERATCAARHAQQALWMYDDELAVRRAQE
jgi:hypothetical protein